MAVAWFITGMTVGVILLAVLICLWDAFLRSFDG